MRQGNPQHPTLDLIGWLLKIINQMKDYAFTLCVKQSESLDISESYLHYLLDRTGISSVDSVITKSIKEFSLTSFYYA